MIKELDGWFFFFDRNLFTKYIINTLFFINCIFV